MNIRTDYLEALKRQQETGRKTTGAVPGDDGFAALFSQEIGQPGQADPAETAAKKMRATDLAATRSVGVDASLLVSALGGTTPAEDAESESLLDAVTGQTSGLLDAWDQYAEALSGGGSQRAAWTMLAGMDDQVKALRGSLKGLAGDNPDLESMVNELEIMTATEKFKFNRGDYA